MGGNGTHRRRIRLWREVGWRGEFESHRRLTWWAAGIGGVVARGRVVDGCLDGIRSFACGLT